MVQVRPGRHPAFAVARSTGGRLAEGPYADEDQAMPRTDGPGDPTPNLPFRFIGEGLGRSKGIDPDPRKERWNASEPRLLGEKEEGILCGRWTEFRGTLFPTVLCTACSFSLQFSSFSLAFRPPTSDPRGVPPTRGEPRGSPRLGPRLPPPLRSLLPPASRFSKGRVPTRTGFVRDLSTNVFVRNRRAHVLSSPFHVHKRT